MRARRIGREEAHVAHAIIAACGRVLSERYNLHQWNPPHPLADMQREAVTRELFLVEDEAQRALATYTIGLTPLAAYTDREFALDRPALYLNRLAVLPEAQSRGIGAFAMGAIESRARAAGVEYVRFDTVSSADFLRRFYRRLGYEERAPFSIRGIDVTCFEKRIT